MVYSWEAYTHDDEVVTLGWFIFGVVILDTSCPVIHFFPRLVMRMVTCRESFHTMIHLGTVEVVLYPSNQYIPCGIIFMEVLWSESSHSNKIIKCVLSVVRVAIWVSRNSVICCFPRVVVCTEKFCKALHPIINMRNVEVDMFCGYIYFLIKLYICKKYGHTKFTEAKV